MSDERVPDQVTIAPEEEIPVLTDNLAPETEEPSATTVADTAVVSAAPETTAPAAPEEELSMDAFEQYQPMRANDVVNGVVMRVDREGVLVDVGAKSEGIIRPGELSRDPGADPETLVKVGETIRVYVIDPEGPDGNPILSKKRADFEVAWDKVQKAKEAQETLQAEVIERVKGGLRVDLGIHGFVPASHVGSGNARINLDRYVGQTIALKVLEVDREHRKVILSNKMAVDEERQAKSRETRDSLEVGKVKRGTVRRLTTYGAFIDLGGIDGLLHISEMSWTRISDPRQVLKEGQVLDVLVLKMDLEQNRVSLGLRQILPDPWKEAAEHFSEGDVITGRVSRVVPFGAFVQVDGGIEGIIPTAEMLRARGGRGPQQPNVDEEVTVKVISLRPEERKMTLSLRALAPVEETPAAAPAAPAAAPAAPPKEGGGGRRDRAARNNRDEERDGFSRYSSGRQEEPRFTIGDAFAAAQKKERSRRERRAARAEEEEYLGDIELEDAAPADAEENE